MPECSLPWPPSINHYYETGRRGPRRLSDRATRYRWMVALQLRGFPRFGDARVSLEVDAFPPDGKVRDLDNLLKALCDALRCAGAYDDDRQIDQLIIRRGEIERPEGRLFIKLRRVNECENTQKR